MTPSSSEVLCAVQVIFEYWYISISAVLGFVELSLNSVFKVTFILH